MKMGKIQWRLIILCLIYNSYSQQAPITYEVKNPSPQKKITGVRQGLQVQPNVTAQQLWDRLLSEPLPKGVTIQSITYVGKPNASGLYQTMPALNGIKPIDGIILTSGFAEGAIGPNTKPDSCGVNLAPGDPDLDKAVNVPDWKSYDASVFIIEFTSDTSIKGITFDFVFGSEEYPEWVGNVFNDIFCAFLDGSNISYDATGKLISVNNNFFKISNLNSSINLQYDGFTPLLRTSTHIQAGKHVIKFAICDVSDRLFDSGVFLSNFKFKFTQDGTNPVKEIINDQTFAVMENSPQGTFVGKVKATLPDTQNIKLTQLKTVPEFVFDTKTWIITVATGANLDFEQVNKYTFPVKATYKDTNFDTALMTINVLDQSVGDLISDQSFSVKENSPGGTFVGTVKLNVPDSIPVALTLIQSVPEFTWNPSNRTITVAGGANLDFETQSVYYMRLLAKANEAKDDTALITIRLLDEGVGDLISDQSFAVKENSPAGTFVGTVKLNVPDSIAVALTLIQSVPEFAWNGASKTFHVAQGANLDFETQNVYYMRLLARANEAKDDTALITINILDVQEQPSPPFIDSAVIYDKNGDGIGDSILVVFIGEFKGFNPNKALLQWPKGQQEIAVTPQPDQIIGTRTVRFPFTPLPGAPVLTKGTGFITVVFDSLGISVQRFHDVVDGIGPLLREASVVERFGAGADTFVVKTTEEVNVNEISGESFILIKGPGTSVGEEIILSVIGAAVDLDKKILLSFAADCRGYTPQAGDSLKILSRGPVVDARRNHAHEKNRPVPLRIIPRPVPILWASYLDADGNGIVDIVHIAFQKNISDLNDLQCRVTWNSDNAQGTIVKMAYHPDNDRIVVADVQGIFNKNMTDRTSGSMSVEALYTGVNQSVSREVMDSAAPVITRAIYYQSANESGIQRQNAKDSLQVYFSEEIADFNSAEPFKFKTAANVRYRMLLAKKQILGSKASCLVMELMGTDFPSEGDSIWIHYQAQIADGKQIPQLVDDNKRVRLEIRTVPFRLKAKVLGPVDPATNEISRYNGVQQNGEFERIITRGIFAILDPEIEVLDKIFEKVQCTAMLVDALGNIIVEGRGLFERDNGFIQIYRKKINKRNVIVILWSGTNKKGRGVGSSMYLARIGITYPDGAKEVQKVFFPVRK